MCIVNYTSDSVDYDRRYPIRRMLDSKTIIGIFHKIRENVLLPTIHK